MTRTTRSVSRSRYSKRAAADTAHRPWPGIDRQRDQWLNPLGGSRLDVGLSDRAARGRGGAAAVVAVWSAPPAIRSSGARSLHRSTLVVGLGSRLARAACHTGRPVVRTW
jgi:hypothetical protein